MHRIRRNLFELHGSDRFSRTSQYQIEDRLVKHMPQRSGVFIEAGANDGVSQSNTYWLERFRGWTGLLIEPDPRLAGLCNWNRPKATTLNVALCADNSITTLPFTTGDLMGYVTGHWNNAEHERYHREVAQRFNRYAAMTDLQVPARTLSSLIDQSGYKQIDLLFFYLEGYEKEALRGLDLTKHRPRFIMIESEAIEPFRDVLGDEYEFVENITPQDILLRCTSASG
jgi:FkbM family methyltransferase